MTADGMLAVEMLVAWARNLTPDFRLKVVRNALAAKPDSPTVEIDGVVIKLKSHREKMNAGIRRLRRAEALVESTPGVMGGTDCIKRTRIPVHLIAALAGAHGVEEARRAYPTLSSDQVELAMTYALAHPRKGRPTTVLPKAKEPARRFRVRKIKAGMLVQQ